MDPLTLLALAKASYEAVKAGVAVGKEIQGVAKDLGSLFDSVAHITRMAAEPPHASLMSGKTAEQMAMEAYAAKAEAEQMMAELKNHFVGEYGIAAWDNIVSETTKIKKAQKAAALQAEKDQEQALENMASILLIILAVGLILATIAFALYLLLHR
jgi:hypothetical protein